ncbi:hypothetical protein ACC754_36235 [Rhizobium johnstonii]|uniref:dioxygenase family protein n=1 Tax=Rhizobium johnstonii TaxID=3019933 RepID=UPI003F9C3BCE
MQARHTTGLCLHVNWGLCSPIGGRYYSILNDGPFGTMLETLGRHPRRAAHIHFIVSAPGLDPTITHIFTPDCSYLAEGAVFGMNDTLVADFHR